jgi:hypothetical protein
VITTNNNTSNALSNLISAKLNYNNKANFNSQMFAT